MEPANDDDRRQRSRPDPWRRFLQVPRPVIILLALALALGVGLAIQHLGDGSTTNVAPKRTGPKTVYRDTTTKITIADQLPLDQQYSQFLALVTASDWLERLDGKEPFTVFVPDPAAFAKLDEATRSGLLSNKDGAGKRTVERLIVAGAVPYVQLASGQVTSLTAIDGTSLPVKAGANASVTVGGAVITKHDISASNGVIQVVDAIPDASG